MELKEKHYPDKEGKHDYLYIEAACGFRLVRYQAENPDREEWYVDYENGSPETIIDKVDIQDILDCVTKAKFLMKETVSANVN